MIQFSAIVVVVVVVVGISIPTIFTEIETFAFGARESNDINWFETQIAKETFRNNFFIATTATAEN